VKDKLNRFDTIPDRNRQTDRQTDRHFATMSTAELMHSIAMVTTNKEPSCR